LASTTRRTSHSSRPGLGDLPPRYDESAQAAEKAAQAIDLRDIFGNPFRPVAVDPSWLTGTVLSLAAAAYDQRRLPQGTLDHEVPQEKWTEG
jgi:hypothetical protein